jgi:hypothetical protein
MIEPVAPRYFRRTALAMLAGLCVLSLPVSQPAMATESARSADRLSYVLLSPGNGSSTMSGSMDDLRRAKSLRSGGEALLYVRHGGAAYVIRDPATLRQAQAIFQPQQALGARQAELGSRQAALGARQAKLGAEQARLGGQQANASPSRAGAIAGHQHALGRQQGVLGQEQGELGRQQNALGREQARLGRLADEKMRSLIADAVRRGVAQRAD